MRRNKGFTLMEMLIVVAAIAILIAIAIPVFSAHLEKTRKATCDANLESCIHLLYAQEMADGGVLTTTDGGTMDTALKTGMDAVPAGSPQHYKKPDAPLLCPDGGEYVFTYLGGRHAIIGYCTKHGGSGGLSGATDGLAAEFIRGLIDAYLHTPGIPSGVPIDSNAPNNGSNLKKLLDAYPGLAQILAKMNVKTWALRKESGTPIAWFTDVDITTLAVGDKVRVIRYNQARGTFTAGYMTIGDSTLNKQTYNTLAGGTDDDVWIEAPGQTPGTKDSYADTLDLFNNLPEVRSN